MAAIDPDERVAFMRRAFEAYEAGDMETGDRHVVGHTHQTARGRGSGVEVSREVAYVNEIRDGRCIFLGLEPTFEGALAVARRREGLADSGAA